MNNNSIKWVNIISKITMHYQTYNFNTAYIIMLEYLKRYALPLSKTASVQQESLCLSGLEIKSAPTAYVY